ncbi:MAG TPA: hypothetical protein VJ302_27410 [Blastocatellia bacterium]|nr:hypothetical protein [Blastocatellia bacterium]
MNPFVKPEPELLQSESQTGDLQVTVTGSLRATFAESLGQMFAFEKGSSLKSVCLFAASVMTLSWFIDSLLPVVQEVSQFVATRLTGAGPESHFVEPLIKLLLPAMAFGATVAFLVFNAQRNARSFVVASVVPDPHPGLILQLSAYHLRSPSGQSCYTSSAELRAALSSETVDLAEVLKSNWGQMVFGVRYHAPVLRYCWIVCTRGPQGSSRHFDMAEGLIRIVVNSVAGREVTCYKVEIDDENDIGQTAQHVTEIYRRLSETAPELRPKEVIADFTGGTTAMSGGTVLASLHEDREIQYIRRGVPLSLDLDAAAVRAQRIIISPQKLRVMVENFARKK